MAGILGKLRSAFFTYISKKHEEKVVLFQSDDWGLECNRPDGAIGSSPRSYETLETVQDLNSLMQVLEYYQDEKGNHPNFTLNIVTSNPDYNKIKESGFTRYIWKPISKGFNHSAEPLTEKWKEGIKKRVFSVAYHGQVHFNTGSWLSLLKKSDKLASELFDKKIWTTYFFSDHEKYKLISGNYSSSDQKLMPIPMTDYADREQSGIDVFKQVFGFIPSSYIAPQYYVTRQQILFYQKKGITALQSANNLSDILKGTKHFRWHGQKKMGPLRALENGAI